MLEEVEYDDKDDAWLVTLGYDSRGLIKRKSGLSPLEIDEEEEVKRRYKLFKIKGQTGELISMKIRNV